MSKGAIFGYTVLGLLGIVALTLFLNGVGLLNYAIFAPAQTRVDNKVFHESQQYNDGMIRDLENLKREYIEASPEAKSVLKGTIIHRFEIYDYNRLPPDLQSFYSSVVSN